MYVNKNKILDKNSKLKEKFQKNVPTLLQDVMQCAKIQKISLLLLFR